MRTLSIMQHNVLDVLGDQDEGVRVIGWHDDHNGPIVHNPRRGLRAVVKPSGGFKRITA